MLARALLAQEEARKKKAADEEAKRKAASPAETASSMSLGGGGGGDKGAAEAEKPADAGAADEWETVTKKPKVRSLLWAAPNSGLLNVVLFMSACAGGPEAEAACRSWRHCWRFRQEARRSPGMSVACFLLAEWFGWCSRSSRGLCMNVWSAVSLCYVAASANYVPTSS
jgi:hypothetical protein